MNIAYFYLDRRNSTSQLPPTVLSEQLHQCFLFCFYNLVRLWLFQDGVEKWRQKEFQTQTKVNAQLFWESKKGNHPVFLFKRRSHETTLYLFADSNLNGAVTYHSFDVKRTEDGFFVRHGGVLVPMSSFGREDNTFSAGIDVNWAKVRAIQRISVHHKNSRKVL